MKIASATVLAFTFTLAASSARADRVVPPPVPELLVVSDSYSAFLVGHAVGTQNYICTATPNGLRWLFIGPQATVFDADGKQILTHFQSTNPFELDPAKAIQATWQHSRDTSAVWARRLRGSIDPMYVAPDAIEWLLLEVTGQVAGPDGSDKLVPAVLIQRVNTIGGKEPSTPCSDALLNTRRLVPYEADYYFYR